MWPRSQSSGLSGLRECVRVRKVSYHADAFPQDAPDAEVVPGEHGGWKARPGGHNVADTDEHRVKCVELLLSATRGPYLWAPVDVKVALAGSMGMLQ